MTMDMKECIYFHKTGADCDNSLKPLEKMSVFIKGPSGVLRRRSEENGNEKDSRILN